MFRERANKHTAKCRPNKHTGRALRVGCCLTLLGLLGSRMRLGLLRVLTFGLLQHLRDRKGTP